MPQNPSPDEYLPLLTTQKNRAFAWIVESGFDPRGFEVTEAFWGEGIPCTRFEYVHSDYFLDVSTARGAYHLRYSPGASELLTHQMDYSRDFESIEEGFKAWLGYLRREAEAPDLWALLHELPDHYSIPPTPDANEPFDEAEIRQIVAGVESARAYVRELQLSPSDYQIASVKLDYLVDAARHARRYDWFQIAFTVVWTLMVSAAFDPEQAQTIFNLIIGGLQSLLPGGPLRDLR